MTGTPHLFCQTATFKRGNLRHFSSSNISVLLAPLFFRDPGKRKVVKRDPKDTTWLWKPALSKDDLWSICEDNTVCTLLMLRAHASTACGGWDGFRAVCLHERRYPASLSFHLESEKFILNRRLCFAPQCVYEAVPSTVPFLLLLLFQIYASLHRTTAKARAASVTVAIPMTWAELIWLKGESLFCLYSAIFLLADLASA